MFRIASFKSAFTNAKKFAFTHCDEKEDEDDHYDDDSNTPSFVEEAEAEIEKDRRKVKTPIQYEDLRGVLQGSSVNSYDGFRFIVQKQVNLNTAVSHFYWLGSAALQGNPMYQYRIVLPIDEDKTVNVATDLDFNVEGEVKLGLTKNMDFKSNFMHTQQQQMVVGELNLHDESSTAQLKYTRAQPGDEFAVSYMQMVFPGLSLGGCGTYSFKVQSLSTSYGLHFDSIDYTLAAQYDGQTKMMYMRKVNPNRVHLGTELTVDEAGAATMGVLAEFSLKQAKLQLGLDSAGVVRAHLDTNLNPGTQLQLCAEMQQASNHYRFGFGIVMG